MPAMHVKSLYIYMNTHTNTHTHTHTHNTIYCIKYQDIAEGDDTDATDNETVNATIQVGDVSQLGISRIK
jgi:hypothetical protein